jgi:hypothetical protein
MSPSSGAASVSCAPCCCHQPAAALHSCSTPASTGGTPRSALKATCRGRHGWLLLLLVLVLVLACACVAPVLPASLARTASVKLTAGAGRDVGSSAWHPVTAASRASARSCAERASMPLTLCSRQYGRALSCSCCGEGSLQARGTRPTELRMPTTPQNDAGLRSEPPRSVPVASHTCRRWRVPAAGTHTSLTVALQGAARAGRTHSTAGSKQSQTTHLPDRQGCC